MSYLIQTAPLVHHILHIHICIKKEEWSKAVYHLTDGLTDGWSWPDQTRPDQTRPDQTRPGGRKVITLWLDWTVVLELICCLRPPPPSEYQWWQHSLLLPPDTELWRVWVVSTPVPPANSRETRLLSSWKINLNFLLSYSKTFYSSFD